MGLTSLYCGEEWSKVRYRTGSTTVQSSGLYSAIGWYPVRDIWLYALQSTVDWCTVQLSASDSSVEYISTHFSQVC